MLLLYGRYKVSSYTDIINGNDLDVIYFFFFIPRGVLWAGVFKAY
jgi:hypothetical protein